MLPAETRLEVFSAVPPRTTRDRPPLLFVHGGYCDGWCWQPYFLPYFAAHGYAAYALSLRGHGGSGGHESLFVAGLDDYAADVERVAAGLPAAPILLGHSMGAAVVERLLGTRPVRAAALLAPVPPAGLFAVASRLAAVRPDYLLHMANLDAGRLTAEVLRALEPFYFSDVDARVLGEAVLHLGFESPRALMDLSLRLHWQVPERSDTSVCVIGVTGDRICTPADIAATADHHHAKATMVDGLAHMMMLEREWEKPARALLEWLAGVA